MRWSSTHPLLLSCHGAARVHLPACALHWPPHRREGWGGDPASLTDTDSEEVFLFSITLGKRCLLQSKGFVFVQHLAIELWHWYLQQCVLSHQVPCEIYVNVSIWTNLQIWCRHVGLTGILLWSSLPSDLRKKWKAEKQLLMVLPQTSWRCWWASSYPRIRLPWIVLDQDGESFVAEAGMVLQQLWCQYTW